MVTKRDNHKRLLFAEILLGGVAGAVITQLVPLFEFPLLVLLSLVGLYILLQEYGFKLKVGRRSKMLFILGSALIVIGVFLVMLQIEHNKHEKYYDGHFSELNDKGIESTIGDWLANTDLNVEKREELSEYFAFDITDDYNRKLSILRVKESPDLIYLQTSISFASEQFKNITDNQKHNMIDELDLELMRMGIQFTIDNETCKTDIWITLRTDDNLTETKFSENILLMFRGISISKDVVSKYLP
jgi:hypothetical protein